MIMSDTVRMEAAWSKHLLQLHAFSWAMPQYAAPAKCVKGARADKSALDTWVTARVCRDGRAAAWPTEARSTPHPTVERKLSMAASASLRVYTASSRWWEGCYEGRTESTCGELALHDGSYTPSALSRPVAVIDNAQHLKCSAEEACLRMHGY